MKLQSDLLKDRYYTDDYEWIEFAGTVAYVGICDFKLSGLRAIQSIDFFDLSLSYAQGSIIGTINSDEYKIPIHMPVDGKNFMYNKDLFIAPDRLLHQGADNVWILKIVPFSPYSRDGLLISEQYQKKIKRSI